MVGLVLNVTWASMKGFGGLLLEEQAYLYGLRTIYTPSRLTGHVHSLNLWMLFRVDALAVWHRAAIASSVLSQWSKVNSISSRAIR